MRGYRYGKIVEINLILLAITSMAACLIRTDYNFPLAIFGYTLWYPRFNQNINVRTLVSSSSNQQISNQKSSFPQNFIKIPKN